MAEHFVPQFDFFIVEILNFSPINIFWIAWIQFLLIALIESINCRTLVIKSEMHGQKYVTTLKSDKFTKGNEKVLFRVTGAASRGRC